MANSIKQKSSSTKSKSIKVKDKEDVTKVVSKNKNTVVTGNKSNAVRKKPVIKKNNQDNNKQNKDKKVVIKKENDANIKAIKVPDIDNIKTKQNNNSNNKVEKKLDEPKIEEKKIEEEIKEVQPEKIEIEKKETSEVEKVKDDITEKKNNQNNKNKIKMPKNRKLAKAASKTNKQLKSKKNLPPQEKNVKSIIKPEEQPKEEIKPVIAQKVEDNKEIKSIKVEKVENIKKRSKEKQKKKDKVQTGKRVKSVYDPNLNRWVVKQDKSKPKSVPKSKNDIKNVSTEDDYSYELESGGLKSKFFEEVDVDRYHEVKRTKRKKYPKRIIITLLIFTIIGVAGYIFYSKYQQEIKRKLNMYEVYTLGQQVKLADDSIWYVVETSDGSKGLVTLLASGMLDITEDATPDLFQYSSGKAEYDPLDETSFAYYLTNTYKSILEGKVGKIEDISLLTSKQFVGIRTGMGYGYEWADENILTNNATFDYFLGSSQNGKVFLVKRSGSYRMVEPTSNHYTRIVITLEKSLIKKD